MSKYLFLQGGIEVEAKQLLPDNAMSLSVWLDYHGVANTVYVHEPDLVVGKDDDAIRVEPGMWVVVVEKRGYAVYNNSDFDAAFALVDRK